MASSTKCSSALLLNRINDLLDLAKSNNNTLTLSNTFFSVAQVADEAVKTLEYMADQKEIVPQVTCLGEHEDSLAHTYGDGSRLSQVLVNLLSNSLKFTPKKGMIEVGIRLMNSIPIDISIYGLKEEDEKQFEGKEVYKNDFIIEVADNGEGIS